MTKRLLEVVADPIHAEQDAPLHDRDFARIAKVVHDTAGIVLADAKRPLVHSRLIRRLRALGQTSFAAYADYIAGSDGEAERAELISAVTTNVTSFFREGHHFDTLSNTILPPLIARARSGGRVRIWSAGCSSGEEPYTIAATVLAACPDAARHDLRILATDIDRTMVAQTRRGVYPAEAAAALSADQSRRLFDATSAGGTLAITDALRQLVTCNVLNLNQTWPMRGPFDVIFCRNVVIYFNKQTQETLWSRFAAILAPGGHLMVGHSERVTGAALPQFEAVGITTYRRR